MDIVYCNVSEISHGVENILMGLLNKMMRERVGSNIFFFKLHTNVINLFFRTNFFFYNGEKIVSFYDSVCTYQTGLNRCNAF